jgi:hypothetical protein
MKARKAATNPGAQPPARFHFRFVSFRSAGAVGASNETKRNEKTKLDEMQFMVRQ